MINTLLQIKKIREAFPKLMPPATIFVPSIACSERIKGEEIFTFTQVDGNRLRCESDLLHFLTVEAFVWFLPTIMEMCLSAPARYYDVEQRLEHVFHRNSRAHPVAAIKLKRIDKALNTDQKQVIRKFFESCAVLNPDGIYELDQLVV